MVYAPLESFDISNYLEVINVLARICSTVSKVYKVYKVWKMEEEIPCRSKVNALPYYILNLHIYYPFYSKKVGLSD